MAGEYAKNGPSKTYEEAICWKPMGNRPVGKPRQRWQEAVMEDFKKLKVKFWKETDKVRRILSDLAGKANTQ
jgi:hypothetical protein